MVNLFISKSDNVELERIHDFTKEWQFLYWQWFLTGKAIRLSVFCLCDIRYLPAKSTIGFYSVHLNAASLAHGSELFFSFDAKISAPKQVGSDTSCTAAGKRVENPCTRLG